MAYGQMYYGGAPAPLMQAQPPMGGGGGSSSSGGGGGGGWMGGVQSPYYAPPPPEPQMPAMMAPQYQPQPSPPVQDMVAAWLTGAGFADYIPVFAANGFDTLDLLRDITDNELELLFNGTSIGWEPRAGQGEGKGGPVAYETALGMFSCSRASPPGPSHALQARL